MIKYPTIIVENFFDNPDSVVKISKNVDYFPPKDDENWPGLRSKNLLITHQNLYEFICKKVLSLYYDFNYDKISYENVRILFHKFDYKNEKQIKGKIHKDPDQLAGVIYLNKNINDENTGTSVYDKNKKRIIKVNNNYNTLITYDGGINHGMTDFDNKERLTIVIFFEKIISKNTPLQRFEPFKWGIESI